MNIIIVHHHQRPPSLNPIRGGALRAHHIGVGLQHYGHNISYLGKDSGSPSECWNTPRELRALCSALDPDIIIATQLEDVDSLSTLPYPIIVDLYAQRLMESSFDGTRDATVLSTLKALSCGVLFLVSNPRQRWSWLSTLVLAGVSLQHDPILVIPLCTEDQPAPSPPEELTLIGGGVWWPWQDPWPSLKRALEHMSNRQTGEIIWYGGPPNGEANPPFSHPRLRLGGWCSHQDFRRALLHSSAAFDWMTPNPERELALAFRHMDYMSCGLPILSYPNSPLAAFRESIGWLSDEIEDTLDILIDNPKLLLDKSKAVRTLAETFKPEHSTLPLQQWLEKPNYAVHKGSRITQAVEQLQQRDRARLDLEGARQKIKMLEDEINKKNVELERANRMIEQLMHSVERLTRSIDEVAGFKREAVQVLGNNLDHKTRTAEELSRENSILRADIEKKSAELEAMDQLRARLENDLQSLREEHERKRSLWRR